MIRRAIPVLHIADSQAAETFYGALGFQVEFCVRGDGGRRDPCYMGVSRDGVVLHLSSHAGDGVVGSVVLLRCDDVDALHREFKGRGVPIHVAPVDQTWGMRELYVRDPDGNSVRFAAPVRGGAVL